MRPDMFHFRTAGLSRKSGGRRGRLYSALVVLTVSMFAVPSGARAECMSGLGGWACKGICGLISYQNCDRVEEKSRQVSDVATKYAQGVEREAVKISHATVDAVKGAGSAVVDAVVTGVDSIRDICLRSPRHFAHCWDPNYAFVYQGLRISGFQNVRMHTDIGSCLALSENVINHGHKGAQIVGLVTGYAVPPDLVAIGAGIMKLHGIAACEALYNADASGAALTTVCGLVTSVGQSQTIASQLGSLDRGSKALLDQGRGLFNQSGLCSAVPMYTSLRGDAPNSQQHAYIGQGDTQRRDQAIHEHSRALQSTGGSVAVDPNARYRAETERLKVTTEADTRLAEAEIKAEVRSFEASLLAETERGAQEVDLTRIGAEYDARMAEIARRHALDERRMTILHDKAVMEHKLAMSRAATERISVLLSHSVDATRARTDSRRENQRLLGTIISQDPVELPQPSMSREERFRRANSSRN